MSFQNLLLLQNLYRLKAIGFEYSDTFSINETNLHIASSSMDELKQNILSCHLCDLSKSRTQSMVGVGNENADLMIIDFCVSVSDDIKNSYYTGRSGDILKSMCQNVLKLKLEDTYFTHSVKCKPLNSNLPSASEVKSCKAYLLNQIELVKPKIIITLGKEAYENLTSEFGNFENVRGLVCNFKDYKLVPIYHPSYLLRNPELKTTTLNDLQTIKRYLWIKYF